MANNEAYEAVAWMIYFKEVLNCILKKLNFLTSLRPLHHTF